MDLQETIVLRIKWERGSHLATNYGPVGLQRTTHASSEMHQWTWCTPLWWCLDWIWWFWNLRRLELIFVVSPTVSGILGYFKSKGAGRGHPRWAEPTRARLGLQVQPGGLCSPRSSPQVLLQPIGCLLVKKSTKSFTVFGPRLVLISCDVKTCRKQQLALGTMSIG